MFGFEFLFFFLDPPENGWPTARPWVQALLDRWTFLPWRRWLGVFFGREDFYRCWRPVLFCGKIFGRPRGLLPRSCFRDLVDIWPGASLYEGWTTHGIPVDFRWNQSVEWPYEVLRIGKLGIESQTTLLVWPMAHEGLSNNGGNTQTVSNHAIRTWGTWWQRNGTIIWSHFIQAAFFWSQYHDLIKRDDRDGWN